MSILIFVIALTVPAALCILRSVLGPTAPDRVVAMDALTSLVIAAFVLLGVYYQTPIFLDIALVYALLAFVGTLAIAKYLEGRRLEE